MDLSEYAESLRRELTSITRFAGEDIARAAEMLSETLDSSIRLALLDVLSAAADEITASIDGATIDVRLSGSEPQFVVSVDHAPDDAGQGETDAADEAGTARITLRVSDGLKARIEAAAAAAGLSVNGWLVRAIGRGLDDQVGRSGRPRPPFPPGKPGRPIVGKRVTGFARS